MNDVQKPVPDAAPRKVILPANLRATEMIDEPRLRNSATNATNTLESDVPDTAVKIPVEAYISVEYARMEKKLLWDRVWQIACREEEIPNVGDYYTYDLLENSVIVVRTEPGEISAYRNSCLHRGRRLTDGCGNTTRFRCRYHAWQWNLNGENAFVPEKEDWGGALTDDILRLGKVRTGRWAGYVFVNFDPGCEPFDQFLGTLPHWIDPFEMENMRYKWRRWTYLRCNWKAALEAFIETYHAPIIHPQGNKYSSGRSWSRAEGLHSGLGTVGREGGGIGTSVDGTRAKDHRQTLLGNLKLLDDTVGALTTDTFIAAANMMMDILPETASAAEVSGKLTDLAREMDLKRGVIWPKVSVKHMNDTGFNWHVFPNSIIEPGVSCGLGLRVRPHGYDPDVCIFEAFALERFPPGQEPRVSDIFESELTEEKWRLLWIQDFENLPDVQRGMKGAFGQAIRPNPVLEKSIINLHRNLAKYMGTGTPQLIGS
jgi:nitrite reductase/ring-hydroxylating ferredoxin subunit